MKRYKCNKCAAVIETKTPPEKHGIDHDDCSLCNKPIYWCPGEFIDQRRIQ